MEQPLADFQYKVLEPQQDYKETVIEKSGIKATFTLAQVEAHQRDLEKLRSELEAQIKVDDATMQNVAHFHPTVAEMSDEDLVSAAIYQHSKKMVLDCTTKLDEVNKQIEDYKNETNKIMTELGFEAAVEPVVPEVAPEVTPAPEGTPEVEAAPETPVEAPVEPTPDVPENTTA